MSLTNKNADSANAQGTLHSSRCFMLESLLYKQQLVGQSLSALCASSLEYVSTISSLHSFSEAVLLLSLTLFRLVSSEHRLHLLWINRKRFTLSSLEYAFLHNDTTYYNRFFPFCQGFFENNSKYFPFFYFIYYLTSDMTPSLADADKVSFWLFWYCFVQVTTDCATRKRLYAAMIK